MVWQNLAIPSRRGAPSDAREVRVPDAARGRKHPGVAPVTPDRSRVEIMYVARVSEPPALGALTYVYPAIETAGAVELPKPGGGRLLHGAIAPSSMTKASVI